MPKKFASENTKAVAAKARKSAAKAEETSKKEKEKEEEYWRDDDKQVNKKKERKELQEKKKQEVSQRKAELKSLTEQEEAQIQQNLISKQPLAKITKAQILQETEKRNAAIAAALALEKKKENATHVEKPLEENINRLVDDAVEARGLDEAIAVLRVQDNVDDKHPERRLKAAFTAYENANMARIKEENPTMRLSQLKQVLRKEWNKAPENPINQILARQLEI